MIADEYRLKDCSCLLFVSLCENLRSSAFQLTISSRTSPCGKYSGLILNVIKSRILLILLSFYFVISKFFPFFVLVITKNYL